jgi:Spy/CpxP family protein refolding chaperone
MTMWKKFWPLLLILSVSLNIAFVGAWVVEAARESTARPETRNRACNGTCPLHQSLNVTDEQWTQLEPRLTQFRSESEALCRDIQRLRGELIDLIASPEPDSMAIALKQDQILAGQRKMQEYVINHLLAEKHMLTQEQQEQLFNMIREKTGCTSRNSVVCPVSIPGAQSHTQSNDITEP